MQHDGSYYQGHWLDNLQHGRGQYVSADGQKVKGFWKNGKKINEKDKFRRQSLQSTNIYCPPIEALAVKFPTSQNAGNSHLDNSSLIKQKIIEVS